MPPAETVARLRPHLPRLGITRLADVTGLDRVGVPVFQAIRPLSRAIVVSQGKGLDADAARASALMEAAETWHAERIDRPLHLARERELRERARVVATDRLPRGKHVAHDPGQPILWIEGRELGSDAAVMVPYELVHADYTVPQTAATGAFLASTNGLASGNTRDEAACHALSELIERDAITLWYTHGPDRQAASAIDPSSVDDPACREVMDRCRAAGLEMIVWDVTSDLGVPAFQCLLIDARDGQGHGGLGGGCHPSREVALLRALTEAVQVRMTYISGARDDLAAAEYTTGARARRLAEARRLVGRDRGRCCLAAVPTVEHATLAEDLAWLADGLARAGLGPPVIVDLGGQGIGISVVRAVVPGLEGPDDHPDHVPGPRARAAAEGRR